MTVARQAYREAMAQLGAAVHVITSDGVAGRCGMTASAVVSVTDEVPTIAVCVNRSSANNEVLKANQVLAVNTLALDQRDVSGVFSGITGCSREERFGTGSWGTLATGAPVLEGAIAVFDCRVTDVLEKGTHTIFFAEVEAVKHSDGVPGLVYFRRDYHPVGQAA